ncbi:MAG: hypothetical protein Kow0070_12740 [Anaerolineales bacterium]
MASIKVLASHPIQYQTRVWKELASRGCDIRVGYFHQGTTGRRARDVDFGVEMEWDVDLLSGYPHRFFHTDAPGYGWAVQFKTFPSILAWFFQDVRQAYEERHLWEEKGRQSLKKISRHTYDAMADGIISALKYLKAD